MRYNFTVLYKDEVVADVRMDTDRNESSIARYTMSPKQPFMCDREDIPYIYDFLESRCYEDGRADLKEILAAFGMEYNNPYEWCRKTHGVTYDDFWWVRFPDETCSWKDVCVR